MTLKEECVYFCGPYKGYHGKAALQDDMFHGELVGVQDVVTFQGKTPAQLRKSFAQSVDDYLDFCDERGEDPAKPYSGKFVTRMPPQLHKQLSEQAEKQGVSMNQYIVDLLTLLVQASPFVPHVLEAAIEKEKKPTKGRRAKR